MFKIYLGTKNVFWGPPALTPKNIYLSIYIYMYRDVWTCVNTCTINRTFYVYVNEKECTYVNMYINWSTPVGILLGSTSCISFDGHYFMLKLKMCKTVLWLVWISYCIWTIQVVLVVGCVCVKIYIYIYMYRQSCNID